MLPPGASILLLGCIELENLVPTKNKFHYYLNPERKVSEKAFEIHGYKDEFSSKQKKFKDIVSELLDFIKDKRLIIHNADFDITHLNNELSLTGNKKLSNEIVDTLSLAREKFPGSSVSLDALCKRYRIDNSRRTKHTALIDCDLLTKVYINLIDQKEPKLNFLKDDVSSYNKKIKNVSYFKKIVEPTSDEIEKHKIYLNKNLKKNFFN